MPSTPWLGQASVTVCSITATANERHAVTLVVRRSTLTTARAFFDEAKANEVAALTVSGLGEDAFYRPTFGDLYVLLGDTELQILIAPGGTPPATPSVSLMALAQRILSRV
jgi:hypothetical protein